MSKHFIISKEVVKGVVRTEEGFRFEFDKNYKTVKVGDGVYVSFTELKAYIDNVAFGQAMASVQSGAKSNIQNISQWAEKTIDDSVKDLINGMEEAVPGLEIDEKDSELQDLIRNAKSQISA